MAKTRLLGTVCTLAMLAAVPALAQQPGMSSSDQTAPAEQGASTPAHHGRMHARNQMHGRSDSSQNEAVDRLNEQSYQAAQQGQAFSGNGSDAGSGSMNSSGGSGSGGMSNGGMSGSGMSGSGMSTGGTSTGGMSGGSGGGTGSGSR